MIWLWLFLGCYVAPMAYLIFTYSVYEHENPFSKKHIGQVLMPFKNLYIALVLILACITFSLIQFGEFCEDVGKAFKKNFC
jgi:hypothetical protein